MGRGERLSAIRGDTGQVYWGQLLTSGSHTLTLWVIMCPLAPLVHSESPPGCVCVNDKSTVFGGIKLASHRVRGVDNSGLCPVRWGGEGHG